MAIIVFDENTVMLFTLRPKIILIVLIEPQADYTTTGASNALRFTFNRIQIQRHLRPHAMK